MILVRLSASLLGRELFDWYPTREQLAQPLRQNHHRGGIRAEWKGMGRYLADREVQQIEVRGLLVRKGGWLAVEYLVKQR